jgi:hypothetical protein
MFLTIAAHDVGRIFDNATKTGDSPSRSRDIIQLIMMDSLVCFST